MKPLNVNWVEYKGFFLFVNKIFVKYSYKIHSQLRLIYAAGKQRSRYFS